MKYRMMCKRVMMAVILRSLALLGLSASLSPGWAFECGDILDRGNYKLEQDVVCAPGDGPAFTLTGEAKLDLSGHAIDCNGTKRDGVLLTGSGDKVFNGVVRQCDDGVKVAGTGHHLIKQVTSQNNNGDGFETISDNNRFLENIARDNKREGVNVTGESKENRFESNEAIANGRNGFFIEFVSTGAPAPTQHVLRLNVASANGQGGFQIQANDNLVVRNSASGNGRQGLKIQGGDNNKLVRNVAFSNCRDGIEIQDGSNNTIRLNTAEQNGNADACPADTDFRFGKDFRPWFYAGLDTLDNADNNLVARNTANDNLGCWVVPDKRTGPENNPDPDIAWEACIGFVPTSLDEAKVALRNRNLWDENTDSKYQCNSTNEWVNNRADEEKKAAPECPCVADFGEECPLADK